MVTTEAPRRRTARVHDGPSVLRHVASVAQLEQDPRWVGMLTPPVAASALPGVAPRGAGPRIASINIHMGVPAGMSLDPANEEIAALRDVARWIETVDADVVFLQEVRNRPWVPGQAGISDAVSALAHLTRASDLAFTPAVAGNPFTGPQRHYGTAILTRNGYGIERAINAALPNLDTGIEARSAGVAAIVDAGGRPAFTAIGTHLTNRPTPEEQALRGHQLTAIAQMAEAVRAGRGFAYRDALESSLQLADGFASRRVVLAGDLNEQQAAVDAVLGPRGFEHAADAFERSGASAQAAAAARAPTANASDGTPHRIDHGYVWRGARIDGMFVSAVPRHELRAGDPTDHAGVVIDLPR